MLGNGFSKFVSAIDKDTECFASFVILSFQFFTFSSIVR